MTKRYRSEAFAAIHETMDALHEVGAIDKQTMREFDEACLTTVRVLRAETMKGIIVSNATPIIAFWIMGTGLNLFPLSLTPKGKEVLS